MDDVEWDKYNFIDGCGFILIKCVMKVIESLNLEILYEGIKLLVILLVF